MILIIIGIGTNSIKQQKREMFEWLGFFLTDIFYEEKKKGCNPDYLSKCQTGLVKTRYILRRLILIFMICQNNTSLV